MSIEKQRARLVRKIVALEAAQDVLNTTSSVIGAVAGLFSNLAQTVKMAEVDAAKQYRDLTGTTINVSDGALGAVYVPSDDDDDLDDDD